MKKFAIIFSVLLSLVLVLFLSNPTYAKFGLGLPGVIKERVKELDKKIEELEDQEKTEEGKLTEAQAIALMEGLTTLDEISAYFESQEEVCGSPEATTNTVNLLETMSKISDIRSSVSEISFKQNGLGFTFITALPIDADTGPAPQRIAIKDALEACHVSAASSLRKAFILDGSIDIFTSIWSPCKTVKSILESKGFNVTLVESDETTSTDILRNLDRSYKAVYFLGHGSYDSATNKYILSKIKITDMTKKDALLKSVSQKDYDDLISGGLQIIGIIVTIYPPEVFFDKNKIISLG